MPIHKPLHPSLTVDRIMERTEAQMFDLEDPGLCTACGEEQGGCEPDAREYECEGCGRNTVYGAQELMMEVCG